MSSGLECLFVERDNGKWYYLLERWDAPRVTWDWREHADCYGPFSTWNEAWSHLRVHHANPGGSSTESFRDPVEWDKTMEAHFANART